LVKQTPSFNLEVLYLLWSGLFFLSNSVSDKGKYVYPPLFISRTTFLASVTCYLFLFMFIPPIFSKNSFKTETPFTKFSMRMRSLGKWAESEAWPRGMNKTWWGLRSS
jgi:hypothetical protein